MPPDTVSAPQARRHEQKLNKLLRFLRLHWDFFSPNKQKFINKSTNLLIEIMWHDWKDHIYCCSHLSHQIICCLNPIYHNDKNNQTLLNLLIWFPVLFLAHRDFIYSIDDDIITGLMILSWRNYSEMLLKYSFHIDDSLSFSIPAKLSCFLCTQSCCQLTCLVSLTFPAFCVPSQLFGGTYSCQTRLKHVVNSKMSRYISWNYKTSRFKLFSNNFLWIKYE